MAEIRIDNLRKLFGDFVAVRDSSFTIEDIPRQSRPRLKPAIRGSPFD